MLRISAEIMPAVIMLGMLVLCICSRKPLWLTFFWLTVVVATSVMLVVCFILPEDVTRYTRVSLDDYYLPFLFLVMPVRFSQFMRRRQVGRQGF